MGFFSKAFGGKPDYPELETGNPAHEQLQAIEQPLQELMEKIHDPLEIVPAEDRTYVFVGKPPKRFGIAWIENGEVVNFQLQAKEHGLTPIELQQVIDRVGEAYAQAEDAKRFSTKIAGRDIVVTPSPDLKKDVQQIVSSVMN